MTFDDLARLDIPSQETRYHVPQDKHPPFPCVRPSEMLPGDRTEYNRRRQQEHRAKTTP